MRFLKTGSFILLTLFYSCTYSDGEKKYIKALENQFPGYEFSLPDRVTNLELRVDIDTVRLDSLALKNLFKKCKWTKMEHPNVSNWLYMSVINDEEQIFNMSRDPDRDNNIIFLDEINL